MGDTFYTGGIGGVGRWVVTVVTVITFTYTIVFNALAGPGAGPFTMSTGNISDILYTCITPAGFTFSIWAVIYTFLTYIVAFSVYVAWKKPEGSAISVPFLVTFIINLNLNVGWLFAWDAINITGSMVLLLLVALTNIAAMTLAAGSFGRSAGHLYQTSKLDFWQNIVVLNGYDLYDTWTTLASLINLTAFFMYQVEVESSNGVCVGMLSAVLVLYVSYFVMENTVLAYWGNPCFTHYAVVLWASIGIYSEQKDVASAEINALLITIMAVSATLLVARLIILVVRNRKNPFYGDNLKIGPAQLD